MLFLISVTGGIFLNSKLFVNNNTLKTLFVFTVWAIMLFIAVCFKKYRYIQRPDLLLTGLFLICTAQASHGILQFCELIPPGATRFQVTGSFDNPAGFASVLSLGFPIGLYVFHNFKNRVLSFIALLIIFFAIILSESRTGILAIVTSFMVFYFFQFSPKFDLTKRKRMIFTIVISIIFVFSLLSGLYILKKDSANGRLLIWMVSFEMIKEQPLAGHGYGAFKSHYMNYQADFFKNHPDSKFVQLADNVKHPFNEFIKIVVELGCIGLFILVALSFLLFKYLRKINSNTKPLVISGLISICVFSFFSYPSDYISVWLILGYLLFLLKIPLTIKVKYKYLRVAFRGIAAIASIYVLSQLYGKYRAEIEWSSVTEISLNNPSETNLENYKRLFPFFKEHPYFLYNYASELNYYKKYQQSNIVLNLCAKYLVDYDIILLKADNMENLGKSKLALKLYKHANCMIPNRFAPLGKMLGICIRYNQTAKARLIAEKIVQKEVKILSPSVYSIKKEAKEFLKLN